MVTESVYVLVAEEEWVDQIHFQSFDLVPVEEGDHPSSTLMRTILRLLLMQLLRFLVVGNGNQSLLEVFLLMLVPTIRCPLEVGHQFSVVLAGIRRCILRTDPCCEGLPL